MKSITAIGCLAAAFALSLTVVQADEFVVDPTTATDTVLFRSTARLEFIEGRTNDLIGGFKFNPDSTSSPFSGSLRVDLRTLKTGIETRDRHMREQYLHTDEYPYAYFEFTGVSGLPAVLHQDSTYRGTVQGFFYIHGGKRPLSATVQFRFRVDADKHQEVTGRAIFSLKLDDYHIERPKALFLKLAETLEVEVIFSARNDLGVKPIALPDWKLVP
jgi:polyisoprenoid-binding protein YceI